MPTMYDNVVLHERLLREVLNVDAPLALIFGYSMGAMAALHFAALFPDKVARVAAVRLQFQCPPFIFSKKEEKNSLDQEMKIT